ncbi:MAG: single-stranded-DNA-specific exonuclease RecJ [Dehalococcoidales bacterium]|nr:single-stranded-DNA-specific exonuclease RecJ [Dehalococcoidales bacterium]
MNHSRWNLLPPAPDNFISTAEFPRLMLEILYHRGITEPAQIKPFLAGDRRLVTDPFRLPDMQQAVARVYRALLSGETIAVYGDFDADGVTATALLVQGLTALGGKAIPYIPHRQSEGHGLTTFVLEELRQKGVSLVITVDCGITSNAEVSKARRKGLDIVITDHHTPLFEVPPAIANVDPKVNKDSPGIELAGVGVAFKLMQALFQSLGKEELLEPLTDLVTIGTIADMSPLVSENRYLVKEGLKLINARPRPGLKELMAQSGIDPGKVDADKIGWVIAPCLNSIGRLAHASAGYDLLLTDVPQEARRLAQWALEKNAERQQLTVETYARAREQVLAEGITDLLFASDENYPIGVAGLVASRLAEEFYRPAIVIRKGSKVSNASCRSIPEFNMIEALKLNSALLEQFGGHSQAAGFTVQTSNLFQLQRQLAQLAASQLKGLDLRPHLDIDAQVKLPELGGGIFTTLQMLAPFGRGNPSPVLLSRKVEVVDCRTMGNGGNHLRMTLKQGGTVWDGVAFRAADCRSEANSPIDIVYNLEEDNWGGNHRLRLNLLDFMPAATG